MGRDDKVLWARRVYMADADDQDRIWLSAIGEATDGSVIVAS